MNLIEDIRGGRRGVISKAKSNLRSGHDVLLLLRNLVPFSLCATPQCEHKHFLHPTACLHGAVVGTELTYNLCALLGNDGDSGAGKCNEYMSCSVVPAHVDPGHDKDKQHP